ncbi:MAG: type 1 glutamine amidotransferase [Fuerstiella sp.]|nr:type 1 glutamine amidotransferase [Fuerstiella sp.]
MKAQEIECFRSTLQCDESQIEVFDLITGRTFSEKRLRHTDLVLIGGSGDYSVAQGGPWWPAAAENMILLHEISKPTFASCWGFQAMARALGGKVVTDLPRAEVGTIQVTLTPEGKMDPVFGIAPPKIEVQSGHQDIVECLPKNAVCLASTDRVKNQAMAFRGKPVYGTQFHPELTRQALIERIQTYPQYVENIVGLTVEEFAVQCRETPDSAELLRRFVEWICD